jgi:signal transduction histidine kinase/CheY-like chemotaxis protein
MNPLVVQMIPENPNHFDWNHLRSNGEVFPTRVFLSVFYLHGERVLQITVRDLTKREKELISVKEELAFQDEEKENRAAELIIANKELVYQDGEKENRAAELVVAKKELVYQKKEKAKRAAELLIANTELAFQNEEKGNRAAELIIANKELNFQNEEKEKRAAELIIANIELVYQDEEKGNRAAELIIANKELVFQNKEKEKRAAELIIANTELAFQNEEKEKRAAELSIANKELVFQNEEKEKRAAELSIANTELAFQNAEKEKRAAELIIANTELVFQNDEKEKRAAELGIANTELAFQNEEKEKRAAELSIANTELAFQNEEKEKRAAELIIANTELVFQNDEKEKRAAELGIANTELAFQNEEKEKRAAELGIANNELAFQNKEKEKRAAELIIANTELVFQNEEKEKRAAELGIANTEFAFQNEEKEKRAAELGIANKELVFQNEEKEKRAAELSIANTELVFQNQEKEKRAAELIIAKENAEESDKLKTAFLQNMSHEIRTPLNGIIGFSSLLNEDDISKDEIKEFTAIISQSGKRLIEIVNNVLDISKIQTGQIEIKRKKILVNTIFSDLFTFFSPIANAKNIILNYNNQNDKFRTIFTDETKLHQILTNLINNAIKFTKSGNIDFGYEIKKNFIQLYVKDTGIGLPKELFERIFDRFIQAEQSMTKNYEGAGLGLAISKGLVELLGGKIWVDSEIDKGTTFYFTLPYCQVEAPFMVINEIPDVPVKQSRGKILIAEDDWTSFQYLKRILVKKDIIVLHVENGEEAIAMVKSTPDINLILMDIRMPIMDGIEATKQIKKLRPDLPIIAQTAYAFEDEKNKILAIGCDEYLAKPLENNKLHSMISKYMI